MIKDALSTEDRILVGLNIQDKSNKEKFQIASKLHTQFGHPSHDKLQKLLKQAGLIMISFSPFWSQSVLTVRFVLKTRGLIQDLLLAFHW